LTSDPHAHELAAPQWSLNKSEVLARIQAELERRDTRQGRLASWIVSENHAEDR